VRVRYLEPQCIGFGGAQLSFAKEPFQGFTAAVKACATPGFALKSRRLGVGRERLRARAF